ncbi:MAG: tetratricopeptide repeat protein [Candidatus Binatia bacterium]
MRTRHALSSVASRPALLWIAAAVGFFCWAAAGATAEGGGPRPAIDTLDRLWTERAHSEAVEHAVTVGTQAFEEYPSSYDLAWRLARAYWRKGDLATDASRRRHAYATARRYAETAAQLDPGRVEGHCYYALTTGDYGGTLSILGAITEGIGSTFEREIKRAYDLNRDFDHGSPMLALGRYYFKLPWPKRDLDQSRHYLEKLKQRHPGALLGRIYLAETDHALGDDVAARQELQYVLSHDPLHDRAVEEGGVKADAQQDMRDWFGATPTPPA